MTVATGVQAYVRFFETLSPASLGELDALCVPDVRFKDPFNDVVGVDRLRAVLAKMFREVDAPCFRVVDRALSGRTAFLRWTFTCRPRRGGRTIAIVGVSEVSFDEAGRVLTHIDHWDAASQIYERIPVIGALLRRIRRRLAA